MKLHILDHTGHTTLVTREETSVGDITGTMTIDEMERAFDERRANGFMAYADRGENQPAEVISKFDPNEREITMHGPMAGG